MSWLGMNKLSFTKRGQILSTPREGSSMLSLARVTDISFNTAAKLSIDATNAYVADHNAHVARYGRRCR